MYNAVGNRQVVRDNAGAWTTYTYDAKNQLTQDATAIVNAHTYNYSYDGVGNRLVVSPMIQCQLVHDFVDTRESKMALDPGIEQLICEGEGIRYKTSFLIGSEYEINALGLYSEDFNSLELVSFSEKNWSAPLN